MSETDRTNKHPIPGRDIDMTYVSLSSSMTRISSAACVGIDGDAIRLHLGELDIHMPVDVWRPIIAALNAALAEVDGTQVSIPDNLDALMSAIEYAEALDGAL